MADFKVIWDYQSNTATGWTEQFYVSGAASPAEATGATIDLINARLALLAPSNTLRRIRASNVTNTRQTSIRTVNLRGTSAYTGGPTDPEGAIVIQLTGATGGSRKLWLRGASIGAIKRDRLTGGDAPPPALTTDIAALMTQYKSNGYGIRTLQQGAKFPITSIAGTGTPGQTSITVGPSGGINPPAGPTLLRGIISQVDPKRWPRLTGHWSPLSWDGVHYIIRYADPQADTTTGTYGFWRQEAYNAISVIDPPRSQFAYYGSHDTRNPLSLSRGAKRAARIRTLA